MSIRKKADERPSAAQKNTLCMTEVYVEILRILDDSFYPGLIEFELIDIHGKHHLFHDKTPIVYCDDIETLKHKMPCTGAARCKVINRIGDTVTIDTDYPDHIESLEEENLFQVSVDLVKEDVHD